MAAAETVAPEGFELESSAMALRISWKEPTHWACSVVGACGLVLTLSLTLLFALTSQGSRAALLFAVGAVLSAYVLVVGLFDRSVVEVDGSRLTARHGPIPCLLAPFFQVQRNRRLAREDVLRLSIREEIRRHPEGDAYHIYNLQVTHRHGEREDLVTRLRQEEAEYMEQALKTFLAIEG